MNWTIDLLVRVAGDVWNTVLHVWPFLAISVLAAAAVSVYVGTDRASRLLHFTGDRVGVYHHGAPAGEQPRHGGLARADVPGEADAQHRDTLQQ